MANILTLNNGGGKCGKMWIHFSFESIKPPTKAVVTQGLLPVPLAGDAEGEVGEHSTDAQQGEEDEDGNHDDDVVTDAGADVQPASVILHQEEEMLKQMSSI